MNTWNCKGSSGISVGGEFFRADADGTVTVPDGVGDLSIYGFKQVASRADIKSQAKIDAAAAAGELDAIAANADVSAQITAATQEAEAQPQTIVDATIDAAKALAPDAEAAAAAIAVNAAAGGE